jgi:hypothetical protein
MRTGFDERMVADLSRSGITTENATRGAYRQCSAQNIRHLLGLSKQAPADGYAIPYFDLHGEPILDQDGSHHVRIRYLPPLPKGQKYASRSGGYGAHIYFPPGLGELLQAPSGVLVITEGEKKAFSAVSRGIACVGLPGVWMWTDPSYKRERDHETGAPLAPLDPATPIHPELRSLLMGLRPIGWRVLVLADSDASHKRDVRGAFQTLAQAIGHQIREQVAYAAIPLPENPEGKRGLDDWIVECGADLSEIKKFISQRSFHSVRMPWRVFYQWNRVPKPKVSEKPTAQTLAAYLYEAQVNGAQVNNADDARRLLLDDYSMPMARIIDGTIEAALDWSRSVGKSLRAGVLWNKVSATHVYMREQFAVDTGEINLEPMHNVPVAWLSRYLKVVGDPSETRGLPRYISELTGITDNNLTVQWQQEADVTADPVHWHAHGFNAADQKGLTEFRMMLRGQLAMSAVPTLVVTPSRGWIEVPMSAGADKFAYVYGQKVVKEADCPDVEPLAPASRAGSAQDKAIKCGGSKEAQFAALRELIQTPQLAAMLGFAAAGPALRFVRQGETAMVHIYGPSSQGKTTLLRLIASLMGSGSPKNRHDSQILSWRVTDNGLEAPLSARSHSFALLDELHVLPRSVDLVSLLYMATDGKGKERMTKETAQRAAIRWSCPIISTGEKSIAYTVGEKQYGELKNIPGGLLARIVEIHIDETPLIPRPEQVPTVIEGYAKSGATGTKAVAEAIETLADTHYGHVWPELVAYLLEHRDLVADIYDGFEQDILERLPPDASPILARRAKHGASSLLGLSLLIRILGVDDTTKACLDEAAAWVLSTMLRAGMDGADIGTEAGRIIENVQSLIMANMPMFGSRFGPPVRDCWGWRDDGGNVVLLDAGLRAIALNAGIDRNRVRKALTDIGWRESRLRAPWANRHANPQRVLISPAPMFQEAQGSADGGYL